jgi:DNA-binding CsgD family transcriptional regulator
MSHLALDFRYLRALAQRVEVAEGEVRIMGSNGFAKDARRRLWRKAGHAGRAQFSSEVAGRESFEFVFAESEREPTRERTLAGLREARAQGRVPGRKPKITAEQKKEIVEAVSSGRKTPAEIARLLKIHRGTVSRIVSQARAGV